MKNKKSKTVAKITEVTELRQDPVTKRWVLISTRRGKRPQEFKVREKPIVTSKDVCPFEDPQASGNGVSVLAFSKTGEHTAVPGKSWSVQVIPNKYPVLEDHDGVCAEMMTRTDGNVAMSAIGKHEVIITRDHSRDLSELSENTVALVIRAWKERMIDIAQDSCIAYVLVFQNHGKEAGASVQHPHSQLIAIPVVPPDVARSLDGSAAYYRSHKTCVHCDIITRERVSKARIVGETKEFIVMTPYAPHAPFEVRIFPKKHMYDFRALTASDAASLAHVLKKTLGVIEKSIGHFAYNLFVHTAPVSKGKHEHYHWHIEILPKSSTHAGIEFGTGVLVLSVAPEASAELFRKNWK